MLVAMHETRAKTHGSLNASVQLAMPGPGLITSKLTWTGDITGISAKSVNSEFRYSLGENSRKAMMSLLKELKLKTIIGNFCGNSAVFRNSMFTDSPFSNI